MAAYELVQMGFDNIFVLKGGFTEWAKSGRCVGHASALLQAAHARYLHVPFRYVMRTTVGCSYHHMCVTLPGPCRRYETEEPVQEGAKE